MTLGHDMWAWHLDLTLGQLDVIITVICHQRWQTVGWIPTPLLLLLLS